MATKAEVQATAAKRAKRVIAMRVRGLTVLDIAHIEHVSPQYVYKILEKANR
jgi:hypothetical protein